MHGYDSYVFGHRDFYPAINRFTTIDWKAEETPDVSPYAYACNNPVRYRDENGDGPLDKVKGAAAAIVDNLTLGLADLRGSLSYDNAADYNQGQNIGDALSIFMGGAEASGGAGKAEAGVLIMTTTGFSGAGAVAGGKLTLSGAFETAHGTLMMTNGSKNLNNQKGRVDEGNGNSRSRPNQNGTPNSSEIQTKDSNGKTTKYTTYDKNGKITKEYRGRGKEHGNIPRPNVKEPKYNTNPKTGQKYQNGYTVRPAKKNEIPK